MAKVAFKKESIEIYDRLKTQSLFSISRKFSGAKDKQTSGRRMFVLFNMWLARYLHK